MTTRHDTHDSLLRHSTPLLAEVLEAGSVAGLIGGVAMAVFATIWAGATGLGFWSPLEAIASTAMRSSEILHGPGAVLVGIAFHLLVSIFFGVLFALLAPRTVLPVPALAFGLAFSVATLVVMTLLVVPAVDPAVRAQLMWGSTPGALPVYVAFLMHLIYGAGLSLAPALRRRISGLPLVRPGRA